jgi:phosphonate transport system substrate-binding protein
MWRTPLKTILTVGLISALSACQETPKSTFAKNTVTLGDIGKIDERLEAQKKLQPFADYLATSLKDLGVTQGQAKVVVDLKSVPGFMSSGEIDFYIDSPYPAMFVVNNSAGAQPILRRWKGGIPEYHTVFVVRKDSKVKSVAELVGKIVAFEDITSSSGYMFPAAYLLQAKFKLVATPSASHKWQPSEIGYQFSQNEERTVEWVLNGEVEAAALDNGTFAELPNEKRDRLRIIAETEKFPRHVVVVRAGLSPQEIDKVKSVFVNMDKTSEGKELLKNFGKTTKFDDLSGENQEILKRLQTTYKLVEDLQQKN